MIIKTGFVRESSLISEVIERLGLEHHEGKGTWVEGSQRLEHLGVIWDTVRMEFKAAMLKVEKIRRMARSLLHEVRLEKRWVSRKLLASFSGVALSMMLPIPLARFYTRSLHDALADWSPVKERAARKGTRTRLSNRGVKDLKVWKTID